MTNQQVLAQLGSDFDMLYRAYARAGLLADAAQTETAQKLLGSGDDVYRFKRTLLLADALIRNRVGRRVHGGGLRHLAVFGGNDVGKSTVVNILAAEQVASTSPEGAHTRHAQAFCASDVPGERRQLFGENPYAFGRFTPAAVGALDRARLDQYCIGSRSSHVLPQDVVLWDMPDCDATGSRTYMDAVMAAVTVADVVVYVTSIERYAVAHLLEWVFLLHDAGMVVYPRPADNSIAPQTRYKAPFHQTGEGARSWFHTCLTTTSLCWPACGPSSCCLWPSLAAGLRYHRQRRPSSPSAHAPRSPNPLSARRTNRLVPYVSTKPRIPTHHRRRHPSPCPRRTAGRAPWRPRSTSAPMRAVAIGAG